MVPRKFVPALEGFGGFIPFGSHTCIFSVDQMTRECEHRAKLGAHMPRQASSGFLCSQLRIICSMTQHVTCDYRVPDMCVRYTVPDAGAAEGGAPLSRLLRGLPTLLRLGSGTRPPFGSCLPPGFFSLCATLAAHLRLRPGFRALWRAGFCWLSHDGDTAMRLKAISRASAAAASCAAEVAERTCMTMPELWVMAGLCEMHLRQTSGFRPQ